MDTYREENQKNRKYTERFPTWVGEYEILENMEVLYAFIWSWGMEVEDDTNFPEWNGVDEY